MPGVRPATPLTLAFLVAFVLLLLTTLSTPIIKSIPLGQNNGYNFGVFGYCKTDGGSCSAARIGYPQSELNAPTQQDYSLAAGARSTLSYILVVHPIAALMVLICTILAAAAHFRGPAHSPRFLLFLLIFTFPTLLITLLAFLVDILLFIPHPQWGTWIVLPATIIVTACGVFTCAMRRTLVSRKARKRRIADNADMNGSEYYAMKNETEMKPPEPAYARAESPPPLNATQNGAPTPNKMNGFAAYEYSDRTPLNARDLSMRSASTSGRRDLPSGTTTYVASGRSRDDAPLMDPVSPLGRPRASSESRRMRGGPGPYGRSGPPPGFYGRGRGFPGPRGGAPRGYGPPRGGFAPRGGPRGGMRGPPPPGWNGNAQRGGPVMRGRPPPPGYGGSYGHSPSRSRDEYGAPPMTYDGQDGLDRQWAGQEPYNYDPPQPEAQQGYAYENAQSPGGSRPSTATRDPASFGFSGRQPSPGRSQSVPRSYSPPPPMPSMPGEIPGQAIEMDERVGGPAQAGAYSSPVATGQQIDGPYTPRTGWQDEPVELGPSSPKQQQHTVVNPGAYYDPQVIQQDAASEPQPSKSSDFYEDMDPRFSEGAPPPLPVASQPQFSTTQASPMPHALVPGYGGQQDYGPPPPQDHGYLSAEEDRGDSRSPAHSDNSNFTSISQRGINPQWRPAPGSMGMGGPMPGPPRSQVSRANDHILASNPDFIVPGAGPSRRGHVRGLSGSGNHRYPDVGPGM